MMCSLSLSLQAWTERDLRTHTYFTCTDNKSTRARLSLKREERERFRCLSLSWRARKSTIAYYQSVLWHNMWVCPALNMWASLALNRLKVTTRIFPSPPLDGWCVCASNSHSALTLEVHRILQSVIEAQGSSSQFVAWFSSSFTFS